MYIMLLSFDFLGERVFLLLELGGQHGRKVEKRGSAI